MKSNHTKLVEVTEEEFIEGRESNEGRCLHCGAVAYGVEPDARNYVCEDCGQPEVYGLEELLMMGLLVVAE